MRRLIMNATLRWMIALTAMLLTGQGLCASAMGVCAGSVEQDRKVMAAVQASGAAHDGFTVEEVHFGTAVMREYIAPTGVVFAIDWKGMIHPDVTQLLGSVTEAYLGDLLRVPAQPKRRKVGVEADEIVLQKWGQPGEPHGRAYVPDLAPQGVKVDRMWLEWPAA
jgi:hypothetical protein